jgi:hypothetical protein
LSYSLYKTTCTVTNRFYIGVHTFTGINDRYLGSGQILRASIRKYGKSAHVIEIQQNFPSFEAALLEEARIVTWDFIKNNPLCMNLAPGGCGGDKISKHPRKTEILAAKSYDFMKTPEYVSALKLGIRTSPGHEERQKNAQLNMMKHRKEYGFAHSLQSRKKIGIANTNREKEVYEKISIALTGRKNPEHAIRQKERFKNKLNHPQTKILTLISPTGEKFTCIGFDDVVNVCKSKQLSFGRLLKYRQQKVPKSVNKRKLSINTTGWTLL